MFWMKDLKEFNIPFIGLKEGKHKFEYQIDAKFFDAFQYDEFLESDLKVDLFFVKKTNMLTLDFSVYGTVNVPCDLTGEPFDLETEGLLSLIVKFGEEFNDDNEEVVIIPTTAHQINVAQYIYEMIVLSVPIKRVCTKVLDGTFKSEVLEKLEELKGTKNIENTKKMIDPRWGKLKDLLIDKKRHNGTSKEKDI